MLNIKTITLVTGLTCLTCHPQAWAMNEEEFKDSGNAGSVPIKPASKTQEVPSDVETQLQMQRLENDKLAAQIAAAEAEAEAAEEAAAASILKQQLEEERQRREELEEKLRAAETRKAQLAEIKKAANAPRPESSDLPTRIGHNTSVELSRGVLAADNFLKTGKWDWRGGKKKKKREKK